MKLVFISHLQGYFQAWKARHEYQYDHSAVVNHLVSTYKNDLYEPNRIEIYRQWTSMMVGLWGRKKKVLNENGRQLAFTYPSGESGERYRVPESLKVLGSRHGGVNFAKAKREDWILYLRTLAEHVIGATHQQFLMHHLFENVLDPIFLEHPGIDTNSAIEIAVDRGILRQWREERQHSFSLERRGRNDDR
jgi:hypothetical protein